MLKSKIKRMFKKLEGVSRVPKLLISFFRTPCVETFRHGRLSVEDLLQRRAWQLGSLPVWLVFMIFCFSINSAFAQTDSDKKAQKSTKNSKSAEIILDDILIEAIIEKPNVAILPTRRLKKFGEIDFINRSFSKELKAVPEKSFLFDEDFEKVKKVENLKEILNKYRN